MALAGLVFLLLPLVHSSAQQIAKRLILKDGSYQSATKWEVHGDRVRYYSAERDGWEEVPNSMVDWPATEKYEKEREAGAASPEAIALNKELEADRAARDANAPQVAPGLRLEDSNAGYLLDTFQGQQQLVQLKQDSGTVEHNIRKTIFHGDVARGPEPHFAGRSACWRASPRTASFFVCECRSDSRHGTIFLRSSTSNIALGQISDCEPGFAAR